MVTDISSINGSIWTLTPSGKKPIRYNKQDVSKYFFETLNPSTLIVEFSSQVREQSIELLLTELRVSGSPTAPVSEASALAGLDAVFLKAAAPASTTAPSVSFAASKSAADALTRQAGVFVRVAVDESNNNDKSMYLDNGSTLEFQYTIA